MTRGSLWRARWIWWEPVDGLASVFGRPLRPPDGFGYLRRSFELGDVPRSFPARITADGRYVLYVNGVYVGRGPARSEPAHLTYDTYDLAPFLRAGRNAVAVLARHYGRPTLYWRPAPRVGQLGSGGLLFECDAFWSDGSWRTRSAPYARTSELVGAPPPEVIGGRSVPHGWTEADFDDRSWDRACVLHPFGLGVPADDPPPDSEPFPLLGPRPIAFLDEELVEPLSSAGGTFDFGRIVNAHPVVSLDVPAGTVVGLSCGEDLADDGTPVIEPRNWTMTYTAAGIPGETVESFEPVGFRYLRVDGAPARVHAIERRYPRPDGPSFSCDDETLNAIWRTGVRTLDLCSTDAYIDCPGREQRAWLGDAYVHTMVSFVCSADTGLAGWNLRLHAQGARTDGLLPMVASGDLTGYPVTIPDYTLHWVRTLARVVERTGRGEDLLPVALHALDYFESFRSDDGLLAGVPGWVFVDWAQTERGERTAALDALYAMALDDAASLAEGRVAARLRSRADRTREAFEAYFDPSRGVYVDRAGSRRVSQQTNAVAILSGAVASSRWTDVLAYVLDETRLVRTLTPGDPEDQEHRHQQQWRRPRMDEETQVVLAQPFFAHFLHQAVAHAGRADLIPSLCRRWQPLVERGNGCFEEYWTAAPGLGSRCHAWSATPTYDLSRHVLGIDPCAPEVVIEPCLGGLTRVEGAVPVRAGLVRASFEAGGTGWVELPSTGVVRFAGAERRIGPGRTQLG